jgi:hypothetical protein
LTSAGFPRCGPNKTPLEPHDLGAGALRLQQERREIGGAKRMTDAARLNEAGGVALLGNFRASRYCGPILSTQRVSGRS